MLKREVFVASAPLAYIIRSTIEPMLRLLAVNGAATEAYVSERDSPIWACDKA